VLSGKVEFKPRTLGIPSAVGALPTALGGCSTSPIGTSQLRYEPGWQISLLCRSRCADPGRAGRAGRAGKLGSLCAQFLSPRWKCHDRAVNCAAVYCRHRADPDYPATGSPRTLPDAATLTTVLWRLMIISWNDTVIELPSVLYLRKPPVSLLILCHHLSFCRVALLPPYWGITKFIIKPITYIRSIEMECCNYLDVCKKR
jgi:hypothetical protein